MNKRVIVITGDSNTGKTTLSSILAYNFPDRVKRISMDALCKKVASDRPSKLGEPYTTNVSKLIATPDIVKEAKSLALKELELSSHQINIIEGVVDTRQIIKDAFIPFIEIETYKKNNGGDQNFEISINNNDPIKLMAVRNCTPTPDPNDILENIKKNGGYKKLLENIFSQSEVLRGFIYLPDKDITNIKSYSTSLKYQSFEEFSNSGGSLSQNKLKVIEPFMNLHRWKGELLDVGCNAGYFSFKLHKKNKKLKCLGVDISAQLDQAVYLNDYYYHYNKVSFERRNILSSTFEEGRFKFILCLSVFHYFRNDQINFLRNCKKWIQKNGYLIIEVAVAAGVQQEFNNHVEKFSRGVDKSPCHFPTEGTFEKWVKDEGFNLVSKDQSCTQGGDPHKRITYILKNGETDKPFPNNIPYDAPDALVEEYTVRNNGLEIFVNGEWISRKKWTN